MLRIKTLFIFFSILFVSVIYGQDQIVQDGETPESELDVAINPLDTNNIIVATAMDGSNIPLVKTYYTYDFGETWQVSEFNGEVPGYERAGDPVVQFDAESDVNSNTVVSRLNDDIYRWGRVRLIRSMHQDAYVLRVRLYQGDTDAFLEYIKTLNYVRFANVDRTLRV